MKSRFFKASLQIATVVFLLFAVAGLSMLAKDSQYFPKSNPTRYVNIANKMKAAPPSVALQRKPLYSIAKVVPPLRDLQNSIVREVRKAWLESNAAFQRLSVTQQLLSQAMQALDLAQQRYKLGLSSIIELSQAQLNMTQAEIAQATAKYDYETAISALNYQIGAAH